MFHTVHTVRARRSQRVKFIIESIELLVGKFQLVESNVTSYSISFFIVQVLLSQIFVCDEPLEQSDGSRLATNAKVRVQESRANH